MLTYNSKRIYLLINHLQHFYKLFTWSVSGVKIQYTTTSGHVHNTILWAYFGMLMIWKILTNITVSECYTRKN